MENKTTTPEKETPGAPSIALRTVAIVVLVAFAVGFAVGFLVSSAYFPKTIKVTTPTISVQIDTVTKRDTVHGKVTAPVTRTIIRVDTVHLPTTPDTSYRREAPAKPDTGATPRLNANGSISIPIEQRTYATDDYTAVVSGWHPSLDKITLYPKTTTVTKTVDRYTDPPRRNWAITVGPAAFYGFDKKFLPGASVTLGFVLKSWH